MAGLRSEVHYYRMRLVGLKGTSRSGGATGRIKVLRGGVGPGREIHTLEATQRGLEAI